MPVSPQLMHMLRKAAEDAAKPSQDPSSPADAGKGSPGVWGTISNTASGIASSLGSGISGAAGAFDTGLSQFISSPMARGAIYGAAGAGAAALLAAVLINRLRRRR